ncbi:hypothetical protein PF001_g24891 [Phytophthora fragariae]|uniref:Uncharacterized protein n=1 Tax=Phytophthora fragariae TaxID=53985 RepID=A0A6A4BZP5_9STRA|nr:hypothetical protein PF001_g24891 [Phytophthora fragariae]
MEQSTHPIHNWIGASKCLVEQIQEQRRRPCDLESIAAPDGSPRGSSPPLMKDTARCRDRELFNLCFDGDGDRCWRRNGFS